MGTELAVLDTDRETEGLRRPDGYAPIESYAALGDGRTVALVARDGAVDWWALPTMDAPPAFAGLLDPAAGGVFRLAPVAPATVSRRYLDGTAVLETTYTTEHGMARVTEALNLSDGRQLPWNELARRVEGVEGRVEMRWEVAPGSRFGQARPWASLRQGVPLITLGDQYIAVVTSPPDPPEVDGHTVRGSFCTEPGSEHLLALVSTDREPVAVPPPEAVARRIGETAGAWRSWSRRIGYEGPWSEAVCESARTLRLLLYAPTGAIAAAPTTSLPEAIGGRRNYDYRFAWVRDMSFMIQSLVHLGLQEEAHQSLSWLVSTVGRTAPDLHVFYSLDGRQAEEEAEIPLAGYKGSRPVMAGNGAAGQMQLGCFGDLLAAIWEYARRGNLLDEATAAVVADCADRVCDIWPRRDSGLWELSDRQHYTSSKLGCWVALDRACHLADAGQVVSAHHPRWARERDAVRRWIEENCWSSVKRTYTFHAGSERLDAAVLRAARTGFDRGPRLAGTIEAVRSELGRGPLLYRYSGMADEEGAFLACSFWLVEALAFTGRREEATQLMDQLVGLANDVGLLSEEMDPHTGAFLGNFPLGLTHLALIGAATALESEQGGGRTD